MKKNNSIFNIQKENPENVAVSNAEVRRLAWHLENLKIVRVGRFLSNVDELVSGKANADLNLA